jgi:hypothetical protein
MVSAVEDTPYCRLYIASDDSQDAVQLALDTEISHQVQRSPIYGAVFKNLGFVESRGTPYDPIESSRWTVEIDSEASDEANFEAFEAATVNIVLGLRARGYVVTASCVFEDRIASGTGWNWSRDTPLPPRYVRNGSMADVPPRTGN